MVILTEDRDSYSEYCIGSLFELEAFDMIVAITQRINLSITKFACSSFTFFVYFFLRPFVSHYSALLIPFLSFLVKTFCGYATCTEF